MQEEGKIYNLWVQELTRYYNPPQPKKATTIHGYLEYVPPITSDMIYMNFHHPTKATFMKRYQEPDVAYAMERKKLVCGQIHSFDKLYSRLGEHLHATSRAAVVKSVNTGRGNWYDAYVRMFGWRHAASTTTCRSEEPTADMNTFPKLRDLRLMPTKTTYKGTMLGIFDPALRGAIYGTIYSRIAQRSRLGLP